MLNSDLILCLALHRILPRYRWAPMLLLQATNAWWFPPSHRLRPPRSPLPSLRDLHLLLQPRLQLLPHGLSSQSLPPTARPLPPASPRSACRLEQLNLALSSSSSSLAEPYMHKGSTHHPILVALTLPTGLHSQLSSQLVGTMSNTMVGLQPLEARTLGELSQAIMLFYHTIRATSLLSQKRLTSPTLLQAWDLMEQEPWELRR